MPSVEALPTPAIQAVLRQHLADPAARLTDVELEPLTTDGYSGNRLYRARVAWLGGRCAPEPGSATWVLKRWLPGGHGQRLLGVDRPLEALAWSQGILRPEVLPAGVVAPILGASVDPDGAGAWIVMEDASAALCEYSRERPLPPAEAVGRVKQVLDGLARLHARWEASGRQAALRRHGHLVPVERFIWCQAASYAAALGRSPLPGLAPGSQVTEEFRADVEAFVAWLPAADRPILTALLDRRGPLVAALAAFPRTLLHGDADDRNIGLRYPAGDTSPDGRAGGPAELVLIDWEWIAAGPPALDVARVCGSAAAVCDPSRPRPDALFTGELPEHYFDRYRAYGGALADRGTWHRSFALGLLAGALTQVPFAGSMIRHAVAPVVATFERQVEMILPAARSLVAA